MERSVQGLTAELERQRSHVERLCKERDVAKRTEQLQSAKVHLLHPCAMWPAQCWQ